MSLATASTIVESLDDLRPLKPYEIPDASWAGLFVCLGILGLALLLLAARKRSLAPQRDTRSPVIWTQSMPEASQTLRGRLEVLQRLPRQTHAQTLHVCEQLAEIVRDLARQRHGVSGRRLTSSELVDRLGARDIPREELEAFRSVLDMCDRVKFSGTRTRAERLDQHLSIAFQLLDPGSVGAEGDDS